jgi:hypothetical protein
LTVLKKKCGQENQFFCALKSTTLKFLNIYHETLVSKQYAHLCQEINTAEYMYINKNFSGLATKAKPNYMESVSMEFCANIAILCLPL